MKIDKSLEEVWEWKNKIYDKTKNMSVDKRVELIKKNTKKTNLKYGLKLTTLEGRKTANHKD